MLDAHASSVPRLIGQCYSPSPHIDVAASLTCDSVLCGVLCSLRRAAWREPASERRSLLDELTWKEGDWFCEAVVLVNQAA